MLFVFFFTKSINEKVEMASQKNKHKTTKLNNRKDMGPLFIERNYQVDKQRKRKHEKKYLFFFEEIELAVMKTISYHMN